MTGLNLFLIAINLIFITINAVDYQNVLRDKIRNPSQWMLAQIKKDLEFFSSGINLKNLNNYWKELNHFGFAKIRIRNNRVDNFFTGDIEENTKNVVIQRAAIMKNFFTELCSYVRVPDVEFCLFLGDGFSGRTDHFEIPIFAFSKNKLLDPKIVLIPDSDVIGAAKNILKDLKHAINSNPWKNKKPLAVWRGASTGGIYTIDNCHNFPRFKLVQLSEKHPDLIDAKFNFLTQMDEQLKQHLINLGYLSRSLTLFDQLAYKYQVLLDGNTSSWSRTYWQLFANSLIFKEESVHIQWYYHNLKPYIHFVPLNTVDELVEKIKWANDNDEAVKGIIFNANSFANENLQWADLLTYTYLLLNEYSKLQVQ